MKNILFISLLFISIIGCQYKRANDKVQEKDTKVDNDFFIMIDSCQNEDYLATLEQVDKNDDRTYKLTIINNIGEFKSDLLELIPNWARIKKCYKTYVLSHFECGKGCYGAFFIFLEQGRTYEFYRNYNIAKSNENIITYIKDEDFGTLYVQNLKSRKEMTIPLKKEFALTSAATGSLYDLREIDVVHGKEQLILSYVGGRVLLVDIGEVM